MAGLASATASVPSWARVAAFVPHGIPATTVPSRLVTLNSHSMNTLTARRWQAARCVRAGMALSATRSHRSIAHTGRSAAAAAAAAAARVATATIRSSASFSSADASLQRPSTWVRESGMPPREYWESLVNAEETLDALGFATGSHDRVLELGCGYGTFTVAAARRVKHLHTFDMDTAMLQETIDRTCTAGLAGVVRTELRDVVAEGYGVEPGSYDAALLFNILHCEDPVGMLRDAALALECGRGRVYAVHWRHDSSTPRGPPLDIRPKPQQLEDWALATGLLRTERGPIDCPPWHYGWVFARI
eukprot:TRINITY_DN10872_c0_g1_i1.p1 TRINITY_DN10872_c0_g1~~TRINITY_DN10872_c0_g1_i1.p1  ORF type:complete len:325 (-),score=37.82 TRINITY_DN10872_c0_g1_i1:302-1213(-)